MNNIIVQIAENCQWHKKLTNAQAVSECNAIISELEHKLTIYMGFEKPCKVDVANSDIEHVVILFEYHHKNERGVYTKWTMHKVIIKPAFKGFNIKIANAKAHGINDLLCERFTHALLMSK